MPLWIPISFVILCIFLLIVPFYEEPVAVGMGTLITLTGPPVFYLCVVKKFEFLTTISGKANTIRISIMKMFLINNLFSEKVTVFSQKLFVSAHEDD